MRATQLSKAEGCAPGCRALANDVPSVRARAFDIVYNMAIHGELILPTETGLLAEELQVRPVQQRLAQQPTSKLPVYGLARSQCGTRQESWLLVCCRDLVLLHALTVTRAGACTGAGRKGRLSWASGWRTLAAAGLTRHAFFPSFFSPAARVVLLQC